MFSKTTLLLAVILSVAVSANAISVLRSPINMNLAKNVNVTSGKDLVQTGRARACAFQNVDNHSSSSPSTGSNKNVTNEGIIYTAQVGVGEPPRYYDLIIDTGSSNTWVGANKPYSTTSTSILTGNVEEVDYGSGFFSGLEFIDKVTLTDELVVNNQSIGDALIAQGFNEFDGILGLGPTDLTQGTRLPDKTSIPTVVDNLYRAGTIPQEVLSVYFRPNASNDQHDQRDGVLTFGTTDSSLHTSPITYTNITSTSPASKYWGIDQSITYGSKRIMNSTAGIVDTGTTLILLPTDAYNEYVSETGATKDQGTGLLKITNAQYEKLDSLYFIVNDTKFELTRNAQIWPRMLNSVIGGDSNSIYLIVGDIGRNSGSGLDFINGYAFLERFYSVFDTTHSRVGFATTADTYATTN
ncbi:acid protease [Fistulina hepatica ATCC 64428]|nr:acid protease [Fistulina hepatica ATCC 64428]